MLLMLADVPFASAQITLAPNPISFGAVGLGLRGKHSISIQNTGTTAATIQSLTFSPSSIFGLDDGNVPVTLSPGKLLAYGLAFIPTAAQAYTGTLTVNLQGGGSVSVTLTGTGISSAANPQLSVSALSFGNVPLGSTVTQSATLTNNGTASIPVTAVKFYPPFWVGGLTTPIYLAPNQSVNLTVSFSPINLGSITGSVTVDYNNIVPSAGIDLTGTGIAPAGLAIVSYPTLPAATPGYAYTTTLQASGGTPPYTWQVSGSGIYGLMLSTSTGVISGILGSRVLAGNYNLTATVRDSSSPAKKVIQTVTLPVEAATGANCNVTSVDVTGTNTPITPLNDLATGTYLASEGGLYPDGSNVNPQQSAGVSIAQAIQPLDGDGSPDPTNGLYALISFGVSATQQPFVDFIDMANADPQKNPKLVVVNGALSGETAFLLSGNNSSYMSTVLNYIIPFYGITPNQVVAAWVNILDSLAKSFPTDAQILQSEIETLVQELHTNFPNLKLVYLGSLNYSGYSQGVDPVDPEPQSYESAFADKWTIQDQINGSPNLNYNPANGPVLAPWLGWGPYYWSNGLMARSDGTYWDCQDLNSDGLHPSKISGHLKINSALLNFLKTDPTATPWFLAPGVK